MGWYQDRSGRVRWVRPGSTTEQRVLNRGGTPLERPEDAIPEAPDEAPAGEWYTDEAGRTRWVRSGSVTEQRVANRGGQPADRDDDAEPSDDEGEPSPADKDALFDPADLTVDMLIRTASDADLATIDRLLREEYAGKHRTTALAQLQRIRDHRAEEQ